MSIKTGIICPKCKGDDVREYEENYVIINVCPKCSKQYVARVKGEGYECSIGDDYAELKNGDEKNGEAASG
jgi:Zn ribbon nucleic-acid-binding protein